MSKLISVFGATGAQGGSVVRALVEAGGFSVRAVTRNKNSEAAKKLASLNNVSLVDADLEKSESLDAVFKDAYGVFLVTNSWSHDSHDEIKQGKNAIDSAIRNGVKHFVFSGLDDVKSVIGKSCDHFDFKAEIEQYALKYADKLNFTSVRMPAYFENFGSYFLNKTGENQYMVGAPMGDKPMFGMSVDEIGPCVATVLKNPDEYKSKIVGLSSDNLKMSEYIDILNKHLSPAKFFYGNVGLEQYASFGFPGARELANMFEFYQSGKMERDIQLTRKLNQNLSDFNSWVLKNKESLLKNLPK